MVNIRAATMADLMEMQNDNLFCLPENYQMKSVTHLLARTDRHDARLVCVGRPTRQYDRCCDVLSVLCPRVF
jgi:hypothetical protein